MLSAVRQHTNSPNASLPRVYAAHTTPPTPLPVLRYRHAPGATRTAGLDPSCSMLAIGSSAVHLPYPAYGRRARDEREETIPGALAHRTSCRL